MPSGSRDDLSAVDDDAWHEAPCGLVILDEGDRVLAANARFLEMVGSGSAEIAGKSFWNELVATGTRVVYLTQLAPVLELDGELNEVMIDLRTATGTVPALLNVRRTTDAAGNRTGTRVALMRVRDRRLYEDELRRARTDAERAREEAETARRADAEIRARMEFLADATAALAASEDVPTMLTSLSQVVVTGFADWCIVFTRDAADPEAEQWATAHSDPRHLPSVDKVAAALPAAAGQNSILRQVLDGGRPALLSDLAEGHVDRAVTDPSVRERLAALDIGSALVVPCYARAEQMATLLVVRGAGRPAYTPEDLADLTDLGGRTGLVMDNLRRSAREHSNSVTLQRAVLTLPPVSTGVQIATRYQPATTGNDIGGDWYDAFVQPDGALVLVVGDVVGHDITAAAAMGQLRGLLRTVGYLSAASPAEILTRSDEAARDLGVDVLASVLIACVRIDGDIASLQWSNAGHPPPVLLGAHGARLLDAVPDRPLGLDPRLARPRTNHTEPLSSGDVLLLYTDGVVERPKEGLDAGLAALAATIDRGRDLDLEQLCDLVLAEHAAGTRDDIALLAARLDS